MAPGISSPAQSETVLGPEISSPRLKDSAVLKSADAETASGPAQSFSARVPPPLLILDLNGSLLCRRRSNKTGVWTKTTIARPHLDELFGYVLGTQTVEEDGKAKTHRNWEVVLWSSAMSHTVASMCEELKIYKRSPENVHRRTDGEGPLSDHLEAHNIKPGSLKTEPVKRAVLEIWHRDNLDLKASDYLKKVQTTKDLRKIWNTLVWTDPASGERHKWGPINTVIVDDSPDKLSLQPDNLYQIPEFHGDTHDIELLKLVDFLKSVRDQHDIPAVIKAARMATASSC